MSEIPKVAALPVAPITGDVMFDELMDKFLPALVALSNQLNAMIAGINTATSAVAENATISALHAEQAASSDTDATAQATSAHMAAQSAADSWHLSRSYANQAAISAQGVAFGGECRLTLSGASLLLSRHNGYRLIIDNTVRSIPEAGVMLAATGVANTTYYVYVYLAGGIILTLEASTTAHAVDPRNGVRIKAGDATRSLVGMARTNAAGAWVDSPTQRFVLSWFNREYKSLFISQNTTSTTSTTGTSLGAIVYFLSWAGVVEAKAIVSASNNNSSSGYGVVGIAIDGGSYNGTMAATFAGLYVMIGFAPIYPFVMSEGYHYLEIKGSVSTGSLNVNSGSLCATIWG